MSELPKSVETIFGQAVDLPAAERRACLDQVCAGDHALRSRVEALLRAHDEAGNLLDAAPGDAVRAALATPLPEEKPGTLIGRYKLLQKIGEGGCGVVYLAEQQEPVVRRVALKVIKLGMDTREVIARFEAERQALALMDHPNIARVLDAGATEHGRPFFVMELVRGVPITKYCDEQNLPTPARLELFTSVCQAVQHAHQKGIIHRDLKPSNILVTINDGVPVPKVIDFGIAKATQGRLTDRTLFTAFEQFIGTPAYMSPEQAEMSSVDVDTRSDIYSLGVLLYELLTGQTPFDAKSLLQAGLDEIRRVIREVEPPKPSARLSTLTDADRVTVAKLRGTAPAQLSSLLCGDLDWIVMRCLEKDRRRRYETANGLTMDLQRHLSNEPVIARPPSTTYLLQKLIRRNRLAFAAATAVAASLILGLILSTVLFSREKTARQHAVAAEQAQRQLRSQADAARALEAKLRRQVSRQLERQSVDKGTERLDQADYMGALPWFAEALRLNEGDAAAEALNRTRIGAVLRTYPTLLQFFTHTRDLIAVEFSPDGQRVVTASADKSARVWDARSGAPITAPLQHAGEVYCAHFSPDGHRVVTGSFDRTVRVWNANTGEPLTAPIQHKGNVNCADFSPDGLQIVTASEDHTSRVWDAATGQPITPPLRHDGAVYSAAFSPNGRHIVTASQDHTACIWDAATGQRAAPALRHAGEVWQATFSADGRFVATASADRTARIWDAHTGTAVTAPLLHSEEVTFVAFGPDDQRLVSASGKSIFRWDFTEIKGTARVWDVATGQPLTPPMQHEGAVFQATFSPDGRRVVTASGDKTARVWDAKTGEPLTPPLLHGSDVYRASFAPDGRRIVTASDSEARIWDVRIERPASVLLQASQIGSYRMFSLSSDEKWVAGAYYHGPARIWNALTGLPLGPVFETKGMVNKVIFSPDGRMIATAGADHLTRLWDATTGAAVTPPMAHNDEVLHLAFSPDGQRVITASADATARIWNAQTGAPLTPPLQHAGKVRSVAFSANGRSVVTASEDKTAGVWDASTGAAIASMSHDDEVKFAAFSPNGERVVTACRQGAMRIWDPRTGSPLGPTIKLAGEFILLGGIESVAFSPDSLRIVTANSDKTARVWDATTGQPVTPPLRHGAEVFSAVFSHDGRCVVTASRDFTARVWDAATGQPVTPPLKHDGMVDYAVFTAGDRAVKTISHDLQTHEVRIWTWDITPDNRPTPFLLNLAEMLSVRHIDASGAMVPSDREAMIASWRALRP